MPRVGERTRSTSWSAADVAGTSGAGYGGLPALTGTQVSVSRIEAYRPRVAIYGRGLRQAEGIPAGWAPQSGGGHA